MKYLLYGEGQGYGDTSWAYTGLCPLLDADGTPLLVAEACGIDPWTVYVRKADPHDREGWAARHAR